MQEALHSAVTFYFKSMAVYNSARDVYDRCNQENKLTTSEKVHVCAQSAFCLLQFFDAGLYAATKLNKEKVERFVGGEDRLKRITLGLTIATGVGDAARTITTTCVNEMDALPSVAHVAAVLIFRANESISQADNLNMIPEDQKPKYARAQLGLDVASCVLEVYNNWDEIDRWTQKAIRYFEDRDRRSERCNPATIGSNHHQTPPGGSNAPSLASNRSDATQNGIETVSSPSQPVTPLGPPIRGLIAPAHIRNTKELNDYHKEMVTSLHNWHTNNIIHDAFRNEPSLEIFKCHISQHPARHLVFPKNNGNAISPRYDKTALETWIRTRPNELPPGWPPNLKLSMDNVERHERDQQYLEMALANLSERFKRFES